MQWVLAAILLIVVLGLFWDVFARGKRGASRVLGISAGLAAATAGILQGAEVDRPWPLLALVAFIVLMLASVRADRRGERTRRI